MWWTQPTRDDSLQMMDTRGDSLLYTQQVMDSLTASIMTRDLCSRVDMQAFHYREGQYRKESVTWATSASHSSYIPITHYQRKPLPRYCRLQSRSGVAENVVLQQPQQTTNTSQSSHLHPKLVSCTNNHQTPSSERVKPVHLWLLLRAQKRMQSYRNTSLKAPPNLENIKCNELPHFTSP